MMSRNHSRRADWLALAVWLLLLVGYLYNLSGWRVHDDEGEYLYQVWRMTQGEVPYLDFLTPQLPVFLYGGWAVMELGGSSLVVMRLYNVLLTFVAAGLLYLAGRRHANWLVGLLAMGLFLTHPDVFNVGRIFRNEPSMVVLVAAGLVLATWPGERRRRRRLVLAGICFGLATMSKLFGVLPAAGIGLWLVCEWLRGARSHRELFRDGAALGIPLVLVVMVLAGAFTLAAPSFFDLVLGHHLAQGSEQTLGAVAGTKLRLYWEYLGFYPVFVPLALLSACWGWARRDGRRRWAWQIPVVLVFLALSRGLGQRHFLFLVPALSLLAAWLLADALQVGRWWMRVLSAAALLAVIVPAVETDVWRAGWRDSDTETIVQVIRERTMREDTILADDIGLCFYSRRATTYSGAALSHGAVTSGQITGELLIEEMVATSTRMVVIDQSLLTANHMVFLRDYPRFHRFLDANYERIGRFRRDYQELDIWLRDPELPFLTEDHVSVETLDGTRFGETMRLVGYSLPGAPVTAGSPLAMTLYWNSDAPAENYWSVFVHVVAPDGSLTAQHDKIPYDGLYPPDRWWPGQIIDDFYLIQIPPEAPAGDFRLAVGMYDWQTGERLALWTPDGRRVDDDRLWLEGTIKVVLPPPP